jgi:hypothetical protein
MRAYISSTLADLAEHRRAVYTAIERLEFGVGVELEIVRPEDLESSGQPTLALLLQQIKHSSLFILLLGWRYGYVPEGEDRSIVEIEYEKAKETRCVILCFIADETCPVEARYVETGTNASKLRRFKERVTRENIVRSFRGPDDLAKEVAIAINLFMNTPMSKLGQDVVDRPELEKQLKLCREERVHHIDVIYKLRQRLQDIVPANPIWRGRRFETDSTLAFCLLPFKDNFMRVFEEGVLPAIEAAGLRGIHAGQIFDNREIIEDIWESISTCRIVVADVTDRNPNVFYELGICHTLGKEVIVITQRAEDVPFDIRHRRFIEYHPDKMTSLRNQLQQTVQRVLLRSNGEISDV